MSPRGAVFPIPSFPIASHFPAEVSPQGSWSKLLHDRAGSTAAFIWGLAGNGSVWLPALWCWALHELTVALVLLSS